MTYWILLIASALVLARALLDLKTSRPDGDLVRDAHPYRRILGIIMPTRTESAVYFDAEVDARKLLNYMEQWREAQAEDESSRRDVTHLVVAAAGLALERHPRLNRFVAGGRLYQRRGIWLSFSMKRQKQKAKAKLATVKMRVDPSGEPFEELVARINAQVGRERSDERTYLDKELDLFLSLPKFLLQRAFGMLQRLDRLNLLPGGFIEGDGMFASAYIANLGSLKMDAAYHHLYEWGNCPLFIMVGQIREVVRVVDGEPAVVPILPLRFSFDERIEDGLSARDALREMELVLEDPVRHLELDVSPVVT